jgi:hypothetical protein
MTPPTPQQPTEASPSAEAMEAARKLVGRIANFIITAYQNENRNKAEAATEAAEIRIAQALDAHFAREFARRVEEALAHWERCELLHRRWSGEAVKDLPPTPDLLHQINAEFAAIGAALRALGGEGGKR